jgi:hypothetical protein
MKLTICGALLSAALIMPSAASADTVFGGGILPNAKNTFTIDASDDGGSPDGAVTVTAVTGRRYLAHVDCVRAEGNVASVVATNDSNVFLTVTAPKFQTGGVVFFVEDNGPEATVAASTDRVRNRQLTPTQLANTLSGGCPDPVAALAAKAPKDFDGFVTVSDTPPI